MILEYHRPQTLSEALELLGRSDPVTQPLGGGSHLGKPSDQSIAVVDLQALGLDRVEMAGNWIDIGATTTLQNLLSSPHIPDILVQGIRQEATHNLRQVATMAGTLVAADGRSPLTCLFLAVDARLKIHPGPETVELGDLLPVRGTGLAGRLITSVQVPVNVALVYHQVSRTPADWPLVAAAVAQWPSGRTRVALGGHGSAPVVAFDGPEPAGAEIAAADAYSHAVDAWASAAYRTEMAGLLTRRGLSAIEDIKKNGGSL